MTISVTEFKARCLSILREVESTGKPIEISRQGRVRFRVLPVHQPDRMPWKRLVGTGRLLADAEESVLHDSDFSANE